MEQNKEFLDRLAQAVKIVGGNKPASRVMKVSEKSVERYKSAGGIGFSEIRSLASAANVSLDWLAYGVTRREKTPLKTGGFSEPDHAEYIPPPRGVAMLPVLDVQASAGAGRVVHDERTIGFIGFDAAYLRSLNLSLADLFSMQGVGESMEPTLRSGEFLLCSKSEHHVQPGDGIFVIRLEGDILVKRLQRLPGKKIKVSSDNERLYEPYVVELNDGTDFVILGKVLFVHGLRRL